MIFIAADHAGVELKEKLKKFLVELGYEIKDFGAFTCDEKDDYPDFVRPLAEAISKEELVPSEAKRSRGIIIGGSGQGEAMAANRFRGVRAVVFYGAKIPTQEIDISGEKSKDPFEIIKLSREHNDANILSLGARFLTEDEAKNAVKLWLQTEFSGEERHVRRISKIDKL